MELYYYTSVETMTYILKDANIFATNLRYMNDAEEYVNGLKELSDIINYYARESNNGKLISKEALEKAVKEDVTSYSISFSTAKDLLSQWSMYAGESGVSLKICFTGKERYKAYQGEDRKYITNLPLVPKKVRYCTKKAMTGKQYIKIRNNIWESIKSTNEDITVDDIKENAFFIWKDMTPYVKRYEFSAEEEYRLVFDWNKSLFPIRIDYRNDKHVLKPYLDIECESGWPIHEVTVGPGFNQDIVYASILHFLNHRKLQVPVLSDEEYYERFKECLAVENEPPKKVQKVWEDKKDEVLGLEENERYEKCLEIYMEILKMSKLRNNYKESLRNRKFTRPGIILGKSEIPYVF